jgi:hypothetical protein
MLGCHTVTSSLVTAAWLGGCSSKMIGLMGNERQMGKTGR